MQKKTTNRARQARATKNKIYRVGIKLIQKYGIDGVNVTGIAKAAGVSVGTFYHYYTSKLDLLMDLYRSGDQFYETDLAAAIKDMPFREKVQFFFREYASMSENDSVPADTQDIRSREHAVHFTYKGHALHAAHRDIRSSGKRRMHR